MERLFRKKVYSSIAHALSWIPVRVVFHTFSRGLSAWEGVTWIDWGRLSPLQFTRSWADVKVWCSALSGSTLWRALATSHREVLEGALGPLSSLSWRNLFALKLSLGQISGGWLVTGYRSLLHALTIREEKWLRIFHCILQVWQHRHVELKWLTWERKTYEGQSSVAPPEQLAKPK